MQSEILEAHPEQPLGVYVLWSNQLPSDSRGGWDPGLLDDPRIIEYWDADGVAARWLFSNREAIGEFDRDIENHGKWPESANSN